MMTIAVVYIVTNLKNTSIVYRRNFTTATTTAITITTTTFGFCSNSPLYQ